MNRNILFLVLFLIISLIIFNFFNNSEEKIKKLNNKKVVLTKLKDNIKKESYFKKNIATLKNVKKEKQNENSFKKINPFFEQNIEDMNYKAKKDVNPILSYKFEQKSIYNLKCGDKITLPEINGFQFELNILNKTYNNDGSVSLKAEILGEDEKYFAILTEGENNSFITAFTPEGSFEFETNKDEGYVYDANQIKRIRINYSKPDYIKIDK